MPHLNEILLAQEADSVLDELDLLAGNISAESARNVRRTSANGSGFADSRPDPAMDRIARLAAAAVRAPAAVITLRHDGRLLLASVHGDFAPADGGPVLDGRVLEADSTVIVRDLADTAEYGGMGGARFYAGTPAREAGGAIAAVLSVIDFDPRPQWGPEESALLEDAAADLESELKLRSDVLQMWLALRETEESYRHLYDSVPIGVCRRAPDGRILMANRAMAQMAGFSDTRELLNAPVAWTRVGEDDDAFRRRLLAAGEIRGEEARWLRHDGSAIQVRQTTRVVRDAAGAVRYWECVAEDITEAKRISEALRATEARFQAFMDHFPGVAFIKDRSNRALYVNQAFHEVFHTRPENVIGKVSEEIFPPEIAAKLRADDEAVLASGRPNRVLENFPLPGSELWQWLTLKFPFAGEAGETLLGGLAIDMTDRLRIEQALRENQERLSLAQSVAGIAAWDWNLATGQFSFDTELDTLALGTLEAPKSIDEWMAHIDPEDRPAVEKAIRQGMVSGQMGSAEYRIALDGGSVQWLSSMGRVIARDSDGRPLRAIGISRNITERHTAEQALRESEERFRVVAENSSDYILDVNLLAGAARLYGPPGITPSVATFEELNAMTHPDDRERVKDFVRRAIRDGGRVDEEFRWIASDGSIRHLHHRGAALHDASGRPYRYIGGSTDITGRKRAEEEVARLAALVQSSTDAIIGLSLEGEIVSWNSGAERILQYSAAGMQGRHWTMLAPTRQRTAFERILKEVRNGGSVAGQEARLRRGDGTKVEVSLSVSPTRCASGDMIGLSVIARDITDRKRAEEQLARQARTDQLTGLPNRRSLTEQLEREIALARHRGRLVALVYFDLDGFKLINDTFGHAVGDALLQAAALRFAGQLREGDMLARMGGDEFMLMAQNIETPEAAYQIASRILKSLDEPFAVAGTRLFASASIGISLYPIHALDAVSLQKDADAAMYEAKRSGKNRIHFYMPQIGVALRERLELGTELRSALERGELSLEYQPLFTLAERRISGLEALLRWTHPRFGSVPPVKFIPIAEETGLILPIGEWVIGQVCRDMRRWTDSGRAPVRVAVNLSAVQFLAADFVQRVRSIIEAAGVPPEQIELELTESCVLASFEDAVSKMRDLRLFGVKFALDDFGTGFSSLSYLQRLPIDALKIDRSFAAEIGRGSGSLRLIQSIVSLAHGLGLRVVIEGLETRVQFEAACNVGCDEGQGYMLARPAARDEWMNC